MIISMVALPLITFSTRASAIVTAGQWTDVLYLSEFDSENIIRQANVKIYWPGKVTGQKTIKLRLIECNPGGLNAKNSGTQLVDLNLYTKDARGQLIQTDSEINKGNCYDVNGKGTKEFSYTVNVTQYDYDPSIDYTTVLMNLNTVDAFRNVSKARMWFRIQAPSDAGALLGFVGGKQTGFSQDISFGGDYSGMGYYDMNFNFGNSCDASATTAYTTAFYDTEIGASWQPQTIRIWLDNGSDSTNITKTSGFVTSRNNMVWWDKDTSKLNPKDGNKGSSSFTVDTTKYSNNDGRYRLHVDHVGEGNDIRIEFPGDEIYGAVPCRAFNLSGKTVLQKYVSGVWTDVSLDASNTANMATGDVIRWVHTVTNNGPGSTLGTLSSQVKASSSNTSPLTAGIENAGTSTTSQIAAGSVVRSAALPSSGYTVQASDAGSKICRYISYTPISYINSGVGGSTEACAYVTPPPSELNPSVTVTARSVSPGQLLPTFDYTVSKSGSSTINSSWSVYQFFIPANMSSVNVSAQNSGSGITSCAYYQTKYPGISCTPPSGTFAGTVSFTAADTNKTVMQNETPAPPPSTAVGSRVCRALVLLPYKTGDATTRKDSGLVCFMFTASPYATVIGGNVWAGGSVDPVTGYLGPNIAITGASSGNFGSFGEYGVFATGTVDFFGSAGKLGRVSTTSGMVNGPLTFGSSVSLGKFTNAHKISNLASYYQAATHTPSVLSGATVAGSGVYVFGGSGTLPISAIAANANPKAVIYAPDGTVLINGNLVYSYPGAISFKDLPALTVVAKNIIVTGNVTQISGNFYASGRFITCNEGPWSTGENASKATAITTTGACSGRLAVNGTITVANQNSGSLVLNRSFGGITTGQPAEIVRMRPESFLTPYENNLIFTTAHESELPARY